MTSDCPNGIQFIQEIGDKVEISKHNSYNFLFSEKNPSKDLKGREKKEFLFKLDSYNSNPDKCIRMQDVITYMGAPSDKSKLKDSELFFYYFNTEKYKNCFDESRINPLSTSKLRAFSNCSLVTFYFSNDKRLFKIDSGFFY